MSPARRDLFRRAAATVAAVSVAALPAVPVAAKPLRLAAAFDINAPHPYGISVVSGYVWIQWADWTEGQREHFLEIIEREFPAVADAAIDHLERCAAEEGGVQ